MTHRQFITTILVSALVLTGVQATARLSDEAEPENIQTTLDNERGAAFRG
ncbi:MAG: hypothetical protein AAGA28_13645 [Pseudomonadota bacterium]